ncbi:hypothetical protein FOL47_010140 [Perkinsus chesapeaki]|uniref:Uncharacterized protein n=1 Tax=Perkinsus chesapeaki TaxID=330153 RepID=A0A7J6MR77_PERCH|nr:hypothetical protein FOL47_010140 [Perkinsus chesapeaki]
MASDSSSGQQLVLVLEPMASSRSSLCIGTVNNGEVKSIGKCSSCDINVNVPAIDLTQCKVAFFYRRPAVGKLAKVIKVGSKASSFTYVEGQRLKHVEVRTVREGDVLSKAYRKRGLSDELSTASDVHRADWRNSTELSGYSCKFTAVNGPIKLLQEIRDQITKENVRLLSDQLNSIVRSKADLQAKPTALQKRETELKMRVVQLEAAYKMKRQEWDKERELEAARKKGDRMIAVAERLKDALRHYNDIVIAYFIDLRDD